VCASIDLIKLIQNGLYLRAFCFDRKKRNFVTDQRAVGFWKKFPRNVVVKSLNLWLHLVNKANSVHNLCLVYFLCTDRAAAAGRRS